MNPPNRNSNSTHPGDTTQDNAAAEAEERAGNPNVEFDAGDDRGEIVDLATPPHPSPETEERAGNPNVEFDAGDDRGEIVDLATPQPSPETIIGAGANGVETIADLFRIPPPIEVRKDSHKIKKPAAVPPPQLCRELQEPPPNTPIHEVPVDLSKIKKPPAMQQPQLRCYHPQQPPHLHRELQGPPPNTPIHEVPVVVLGKTKKPPAVQQPLLCHPNPQKLPQQHRPSVVRYNTPQENAKAEAEAGAGYPNVQFNAVATRVETFADLFSIPPRRWPETIFENPNNGRPDGSDVHTGKSPRPSTPLEVRKDFNKIEKSTVVPPPLLRHRHPQQPPQQHQQSVLRYNTAQENATAEAEAGAGYPNVQCNAVVTRVETFADLFSIPPRRWPESIFENPNNGRPDGSKSDVHTSKSSRQEFQEPRPSTPLEVRKESNKIKKSSAVPPPHRRRHPQQLPQRHRLSVVTYAQKNADAEAEAKAGNPKALEVHKDSHKIKKPTAVPPLHLRRDPQQPPQQQPPLVEEIKSPFLQGAADTTSNSFPAIQGTVSPAAKVASVKNVGSLPDISPPSPGSVPPIDGGRVGAIEGQETNEEPEYNIDTEGQLLQNQSEDATLSFGAAIDAEKEADLSSLPPIDGGGVVATGGLETDNEPEYNINNCDNMEPEPKPQPREEEDTNK